MEKASNTNLFDILSELEGNGFILDDTENLLCIFDRCFSDIIKLCSEMKGTQFELMHDSLTEIYSLFTVIKLQLTGAANRIQNAVKSGYEWYSLNK